MNLFYREFGQGQPMIILHGLLGNSDNWVRFAKYFAEKLSFKVIVPDLRNHGNSPHDKEFSLNSMSADIIELMKKLTIENPIILGHSLGGKIILNTLKNNPALFKAIIIADMGLRSYSPNYANLKLIELMLYSDLSKYSSRKQVEDFLIKEIYDEKLRMLVLKNIYWKNSYTLDWKLNIESIYNFYPELLKSISVNNNISTPTIFLKGEKSDYINEEDELLIQKIFNNFSIKTIKNAGHWLHVDNPLDFNKSVEEFVGIQK